MRAPHILEEGKGTVHFMGIAGAGMVPLAELMARSGFSVSGCDLQPEAAARALHALGCEVWTDHHPDHVEGAAALVITAAIPPDHPEILRARELGIPVMKRAEVLGHWVNRGTVVAVAGTHGKTTTTAMTAEVLAAAELDPTAVVGGRVLNWESNLRFGSEELFVVEADEYDRSFHHLLPTVAVLNNLEADHLDIFEDFQGVQEAFLTFLDGLSPDGRIVACGDDHGVSSLLPGLRKTTSTYGLKPGAQLRGLGLRENGTGSRFEVVEEGRPRGELALRVPGRHNVLNALGAAGAARSLGVGWDAIRMGLGEFRGVGRRFQVLGEVAGVTVVDDYAHHPSEIRATLQAARGRFPGRRIVAVFQPHLYSRTRDFAVELGSALAGADAVWVTEIYPAREDPIPDVTGELVVEAAENAGALNVSFHPGLKELPGEIVSDLKGGDVFLTMGAGSIEVLGGDVLQALGARQHNPEGAA